VIAILVAGDFFGEGCLAGQPTRMVSAAAMTDCSVIWLEKAALIRVLREEPDFSEMFLMQQDSGARSDLKELRGKLDARHSRHFYVGKRPMAPSYLPAFSVASMPSTAVITE
jgi:CRP-like cAMP-binding protein